MRDRSSCCRALGLTEMLLSEQELTVEVRCLDVVGISNDYSSLLPTCTNLDHCEIFEEFAAYRARAHHKYLRVLELLEDIVSD